MISDIIKKKLFEFLILKNNIKNCDIFYEEFQTLLNNNYQALGIFIDEVLTGKMIPTKKHLLFFNKWWKIFNKQFKEIKNGK